MPGAALIKKISRNVAHEKTQQDRFQSDSDSPDEHRRVKEISEKLLVVAQLESGNIPADRVSQPKAIDDDKADGHNQEKENRAQRRCKERPGLNALIACQIGRTELDDELLILLWTESICYFRGIGSTSQATHTECLYAARQYQVTAKLLAGLLSILDARFQMSDKKNGLHDEEFCRP